ncbi:unnamed protein product, partial [Scytosiphon promiscuus]
ASASGGGGGGGGRVRRAWSCSKGVPLAAAGATESGVSKDGGGPATTLSKTAAGAGAAGAGAAKVGTENGNVGVKNHDDDDRGGAAGASAATQTAASTTNTTAAAVAAAAPTASVGSRRQDEDKSTPNGHGAPNGKLPAAAAEEGSLVPPGSIKGSLPRDARALRRSSTPGAVVTPPRSTGAETPTTVPDTPSAAGEGSEDTGGKKPGDPSVD